ncbi:phage holin family protein [Aedoeadaptatus acetigenes]|uniref:phage holin family protein n=1 Tax=Aedoeadaptatus acetigenes TaxID=2981723 RepID=UPI0011DC9257|nr:phage holin family protein [Aedoeadaptatus acetigenes]MCU6786425.1 phage holin family protein [Aedoeadaptatus acetigenes]
MEVTLDMIIAAYSRIAKVNLYHLFTILVILDVVSGWAKAIVNKDLDSKVGAAGIAKHLAVILLIFLTCPYLWLLGFGWLAKFLIYSMGATYGVSIVENYSDMGMPLPKWFAQFFRRIQSEINEVSLDDVESLKLKHHVKEGENDKNHA